MPHPERFFSRIQHPKHTREELPEEGDGLAIFKNAVNYFKS
jgi:phosphoribosylformylglycinamidine synthase